MSVLGKSKRPKRVLEGFCVGNGWGSRGQPQLGHIGID